jgi:hypothetical protein
MIRNIEKDWRERVVKNNLDLIILRLLRSKPRWTVTFRGNGSPRKAEEGGSIRSQIVG